MSVRLSVLLAFFYHMYACQSCSTVWAGAAGGRAVPSKPEAAGDGPEGQARQEQHHLPRCHVLSHVPPGL